LKVDKEVAPPDGKAEISKGDLRLPHILGAHSRQLRLEKLANTRKTIANIK
jgi:hypothetical protein